MPVTTTFDTWATADHVLGFERVTWRAVDHGLLTRADARRWLSDLAIGDVFAVVTLFLVTASKTA